MFAQTFRGLFLVVFLFVGAGFALPVLAAAPPQELFSAVEGGDAVRVEALLKSGVGANAVDARGVPALVTAAGRGAADVVLALLFAGADVNAADPSGTTPLIAGCKGGHTAVVQALLEAGADPQRRDGDGHTARYYAEAAGDPGNLVVLLEQFGGGEKVRGVQRFVTVPLYFSTNRKPLAPVKGTAQYGAERDAKLHYGKCEVTIPVSHVPGELEGPSTLLLELSADPEKHIILKDARELGEQEFYRQLKAEAGPRDILLFVHGYNVAFEKAARRTAQLAYDLKFPGIPVLFSWPSQGKILGYADDARTVAASVPDIERFLRILIERYRPEKIHVIAHSMGTHGLTQALARISDSQKKGHKVIFNQLVLAAPDIDGKLFREEIAPKLSHLARRVSLYASSHDLALAVSHRYNDGRRAGDSNPEIVVVPGVDSIDVSRVDTSLLGHSYYGSNRSIITDISEALQLKKPDEREFLVRRESPQHRKYWLFNPTR
ncbi:alpha/beta hydrolase [Geomonas paludis]|uniref:Uncharacterized protein n=1 Tax=Geomonas paludis TaxID=2740185 RepID=A0A6V8MSX1_9BACT|nr:alpha/beta hydrolase [Geomonas paludis]GFO63256.1 hypothetical protein GMPD_11750 [Geomonas paludis]